MLSLVLQLKISPKVDSVIMQTLKILGKFMEPALKVIRKIVPKRGNFDLSPIILMFLVGFLKSLVAK